MNRPLKILSMLGVAHNIHRSKFRIYTFFMLNDSVMRRAYVNFLYYFGQIICILLHFFSALELNMCLKVNLYN